MQPFPFLIFAITLAASWLAAGVGIFVRKRHGEPEESEEEDIGRVLTATLTLLGLIIGFSFSMAVGEYEQRVNAEDNEARAIGTEYARASLLPADSAAQMRSLLTQYLRQRILFYTTRSATRLAEISDSASQLQNDLWSAVQSVATAKPDPVVSLAISGVNEVSNSQRATRASWTNRIPIPGWALLEVITVFANLLFGYISSSDRMTSTRFWILPLLVSLSFFFIADLDNPRGGFVELVPHNLTTLSGRMR